MWDCRNRITDLCPHLPHACMQRHGEEAWSVVETRRTARTRDKTMRELEGYVDPTIAPFFFPPNL